MSHYFLDSSVLVKRYVPEMGTAWVRSITLPSRGHTILVAQITSIEIVSAVMRRKREDLFNLRSSHAMRILLDRHMAREYFVIGLTEQIVQNAKSRLEDHPLRAYDAVQLASAMESRTRLGTTNLAPLIFVSADKRLLETASAEGFAVDDPRLHP